MVCMYLGCLLTLDTIIAKWPKCTFALRLCFALRANPKHTHERVAAQVPKKFQHRYLELCLELHLHLDGWNGTSKKKSSAYFYS